MFCCLRYDKDLSPKKAAAVTTSEYSCAFCWRYFNPTIHLFLSKFFQGTVSHNALKTFLTISPCGFIFQIWLSIFCCAVCSSRLPLTQSFSYEWRFTWAAACRLDCIHVSRTIWKALDDTFVSGSSSGHWVLFRNTKAMQKADIYINSNIKRL